MRRARGQIKTRQRRGKTFFEIVGPPDPVSGERIYRTAKTRSEAERILRSLIEEPTAEEARNLRFATFWDDELDRVKLTRSYNTWRRLEQVGRCYLFPALGARQLIDITALDVETLLSKLKLSGHTLRGIRADGRRMFNRARKLGLVPRGHPNPFADAEPPPLKRQTKTTLSLADAERVIEAAPHPLAAAVLATLIYTGCRVGEALALRGDDLTESALVIDENLERIEGQWHYGPTKTHAGRAYPLVGRHGERLRELLTPFVPEQPHLPIFRQTRKDEPIHESTVGFWLRAALAACGLPRMTVHALRSSFVNQLRQEGTETAVIAKAVGHLDQRTTEQHYTEVVPMEVVEAIKRRK